MFLPPAERRDWALGLMLGGSSSRMGRDKALLPLGARTLAERVLEACTPPNREILLAVGRADRELPEGLAVHPRIPDRREGRGPLAAIEVLLAEVKSPWLVIVPCDMTGLGAELLELLVRRADESGAGLACVNAPDHPRTFPLALRVDALRDEVARLLDETNGKVLGLAQVARLELVDPAELGPPEEIDRLYRNVNDQAAYRALLAELEADPGQSDAN